MKLRLFLVLCSFAWISCIGVNKTFPEKRFYALEVGEVKTYPIKSKPKNFAIRRVFISPRFEGKEFVYRRDTSVYESDFYNGFFIPPVANLREEMAKGLLRTSLFEWDVSYHPKLVTQYGIELYVSELYGDFRGKEPKAVMEIEVVFYEERENSILFRKTYSIAVQTSSNNPESLVIGWNQGLTKIVNQLAIDLQPSIQ